MSHIFPVFLFTDISNDGFENFEIITLILSYILFVLQIFDEQKMMEIEILYSLGSILVAGMSE
jgi:hypothetical protein